MFVLDIADFDGQYDSSESAVDDLLARGPRPETRYGWWSVTYEFPGYVEAEPAER